MLVLLGRIRISGRRLGQREDSCGDFGLWLLIQDEICEQSFLSASERRGTLGAAYLGDKRACRIIGAGQKFSQERPSERDCAVASEGGFANKRRIPEKVQAILAQQRTHSLPGIPAIGRLYGRSSPYFLPHNLYYDLRAGSFRPSIHQILALSRISGYRVADWLRVFGYNLEDITRLQILLPSKRTIVLDTSLTDPNEWVPWLATGPSEFPCHRSHRSQNFLE